MHFLYLSRKLFDYIAVLVSLLTNIFRLNMREDIRRGRSGIPKDLGAPVFLDARGRRQTLSPEKLMVRVFRCKLKLLLN